MGVAAIPYADWVEDSLLGRAEWLKVVALLTNTERRATAAFADIDREDDVIARAGEMATHPKAVLCPDRARDVEFTFCGLVGELRGGE